MCTRQTLSGSWEKTARQFSSYAGRSLIEECSYGTEVGVNTVLGLNMKSPLGTHMLSVWSPLHGVILGGFINGKVRPSWRKCITGVGGLSRGCLVPVPSWSSASCPPLDESGPLPCAILTFCPICRAVSHRQGPSETRSLQWSLQGLVTV